MTHVESASSVPSVPSAPSSFADRSGIAALTPDDALQADEVARSRLFLKLCAVLAGSVGLVVPFVTGSVLLRSVLVACCVIAVVVVLAFRRVVRDDVLSTPRRWIVVSAMLVAASSVAVWFFGLFSPAPMVGTFGIYFLCLGSSPRVALWSYVMGAIAHLVPAVLIALRIVPDPGLLTLAGTTRDMLVAALMVQIVFAVTYALARGSRTSTRSAVEKLHAAMVQVQKRGALLAEAHLELDQALRGGHRGPFTGRVVGGFVMGDVIGRGAMGDVYEGRAQNDGAKVAVKIIHRVLAGDRSHVKRFLREAQIIAALESPHVVRFLGHGNFDLASSSQGWEAPHSGDVPPYLLMERLEGNDLAWHLRREGRLSTKRVLELVDHVAHALTAASAVDVVHRDLKPQNVFLARGAAGVSEWKVLDFGVSKLAWETGTLTQGAPIGTPAYMAPEQARGDLVGPRADVFSLTCIAYRALTGRPAFAGEELPQILFDVCFAQPMRPGELTQLPEDVDRVLALGLAKKAELRLASARDLADALHAAFGGTLAPNIRARADALLAAEPWGTKLR